jgi:hypothetical protein
MDKAFWRKEIGIVWIRYSRPANQLGSVKVEGRLNCTFDGGWTRVELSGRPAFRKCPNHRHFLTLGLVARRHR